MDIAAPAMNGSVVLPDLEEEMEEGAREEEMKQQEKLIKPYINDKLAQYAIKVCEDDTAFKKG